jgi:hypothetical protein
MSEIRIGGDAVTPSVSEADADADARSMGMKRNASAAKDLAASGLERVPQVLWMGLCLVVISAIST